MAGSKIEVSKEVETITDSGGFTPDQYDYIPEDPEFEGENLPETNQLPEGVNEGELNKNLDITNGENE